MTFGYSSYLKDLPKRTLIRKVSYLFVIIVLAYMAIGAIIAVNLDQRENFFAWTFVVLMGAEVLQAMARDLINGYSEAGDRFIEKVLKYL